jgi:hypothetical protein
LQNAAKEAGQEDAIEDESVMSDEDIEEELGYISPLDSVDPYLAFKRSLSSGCSIPVTYDVTEITVCSPSLPNEEPFRIPGLYCRLERGTADAPRRGDEAGGRQGSRGTRSDVRIMQGGSDDCLEIMEWQMTVVLYVELNLLDLRTVALRVRRKVRPS